MKCHTVGCLVLLILLTSCNDSEMDLCNYEGTIGSSDKIYMWVTNNSYNGNLGRVRGAHQKCIEDVENQNWLTLKSDYFTHRAVLSSFDDACDARTIISDNDTRPVYNRNELMVVQNYPEFFTVTQTQNAVSTNEYYTGVDTLGAPLLSCFNWTSDAFTPFSRIALGGTDSDRLGNYGSTCDDVFPLLCISF